MRADKSKNRHPLASSRGVLSVYQQIIRGKLILDLERDTRIELASSPWKGDIIPLYQSRLNENIYGYPRSERFNRVPANVASLDKLEINEHAFVG